MSHEGSPQNGATPFQELSFSEQKEAYLKLPWETRVITDSVHKIKNVFKTEDLSLPRYPLPPRSDQVATTIASMYDLDFRSLEKFKREGDTTQFHRWLVRERDNFYHGIAHEIKRSQRFYLLEEMALRVNNSEKLSAHERDLLNIDIGTIHLLLGREDRLLVGLKGGVFWKTIHWPEPTPESTPSYLDTSMPYLGKAPIIGRKEMELVPEKPLSFEDAEITHIPTSIHSVEESLEQAYYGQRYTVPLEGAEIRFQRAGDLEKLVMLQTRDALFGKMVTKNGEILVIIYTESGNVLSQIPQKPFGEVLAETYRDMVTAVEVRSNRSRRLKNLQNVVSTVDNNDVSESPRAIYIPRVTRQDEGDFRPHYDGPTRPVTPHRVTGHRRHVPMSEKHRQELQKFEQETGISILENLPYGYTFVRPHVVPSGTSFEELPLFIKRRIETKLKEDLQRPEVNPEPLSYKL